MIINMFFIPLTPAGSTGLDLTGCKGDGENHNKEVADLPALVRSFFSCKSNPCLLAWAPPFMIFIQGTESEYTPVVSDVIHSSLQE